MNGVNLFGVRVSIVEWASESSHFFRTKDSKAAIGGGAPAGDPGWACTG